MAKRELNDKQMAFCQEYIVDLNATQAAIRAGYSKKTARAIANKLLTKVDIQAVIEKLKAKREKRTQISADYVLLELNRVKELAINGDEQYGNEGQLLGIKRQLSAAVSALAKMGEHVNVRAFDREKDTQQDAQPIGRIEIEVVGANLKD